MEVCPAERRFKQDLSVPCLY